MKFYTNITSCIFTIKVSNKLTFEKFYGFRKFFLTAKNVGSKFIVDFSSAEYIDVSGLAMLLLLQEYIDSLEGKASLVLPAQGNQAYKMLKLAKFDEVFEIN